MVLSTAACVSWRSRPPAEQQAAQATFGNVSTGRIAVHDDPGRPRFTSIVRQGDPAGAIAALVLTGGDGQASVALATIVAERRVPHDEADLAASIRELLGLGAELVIVFGASAIADRREFYNDSVNINNVGIEQFPNLIIARLFGFKAFDLLKFSAEEMKDVDVGQRFKS